MRGQEDTAFPSCDHIHALAHGNEIKHPNHSAGRKKMQARRSWLLPKETAWPPPPWTVGRGRRTAPPAPLLKVLKNTQIARTSGPSD